MYKSGVKERFNQFFNGEVDVLFDLDDQKVLIANNGMLYDLYKSKLTDPQKQVTIDEFLKEYDLILSAKKEQYEREFNLEGQWKLAGCAVTKNGVNKNSLTNLKVYNTSGEKYMFPSRFKVEDIIKK